jgi:[ribosomal protein S18]-alanine N-acetyltransferase
MQARIRSAEPADIGALIDLENRSFSSDRISRSGLRRLIASPSAEVIVAAQGEAVAGYAVLLYRAGSRLARLYSLAVASEFRGLGRELLAAAETHASRHGCSLLRLEVRHDNQRAVNLYERAGYRRFGEKAGYYADGATALRFEKTLGVRAKAAVVRLAGTAAA